MTIDKTPENVKSGRRKTNGAANEISLYEAAWDACQRLNLVLEHLPPCDGQFHRLDVANSEKRGKDDGTILLFADGKGGIVTNWQQGEPIEFFVGHKRELSPAERIAMRQTIQKERERREAAAVAGARRAERLWEKCKPALGNSYLARKRVPPYGTRVINKLLVVPLYGERGGLSTLQFISENGNKKFLKGASANGFYILNEDAGGPILIAEGFATAASLAEACGCMAVCAFGASVLMRTYELIKKKFPDRKVYICGDNDHTAKDGYIIPDFEGFDRSEKDKDWNDLHRLGGLGEVRKQVRFAIKEKELRKVDSVIPAIDLDCCDDGDLPIIHPPQLIKRILPKSGLVILGGQSGAGKTFIAIDMALSLASGTDFFGYVCRERVGVLYIAAEGRATIGGRLAAAKLARDIGDRQPIRVLRAPPVLALSNAKGIELFSQQIAAVSADMERKFKIRTGAVFMDTVSAAIQMKDENDNAEIAAICMMLRKLGNSAKGVMIGVHHFGKDIERGLRGASAWKANSDHCLSVLADRSEATGKVDKRSLNITKNQIGDEGLISGFELNPVKIDVNEYGELEWSCSVKSAELPPEEQKTTAPKSRSHRLARMAVFEALALPTIRKIFGDGPLMRCVTIEQIKREFYKRWINEGDGESRSGKANAWRRAVEFIQNSDEFGVETIEGSGKNGSQSWIWLIKSPVVKLQPEVTNVHAEFTA